MAGATRAATHLESIHSAIAYLTPGGLAYGNQSPIQLDAQLGPCTLGLKIFDQSELCAEM